MENAAYEEEKESMDKGIHLDDMADPVPTSEKKESVIGIDLDDVLVNELGQFGRYALRNLILVSSVIMSSAPIEDFIFTAAAIPHRCQIQECGEYNNLHNYNPEWIRNAVPETDSGLASCERYAPNNLGFNGTLDFCPVNVFNQSEIVGCETFVYARNNSVVYDFNLGCNEGLRVLAGTFTSIGTLIVLPIIGVISDRFGRRIALVLSILNFNLFGLLKAFSVNYTMFLALQLLQTSLGSGIYSSGYIFAAELVGPKYRVLVSAICSTVIAIGAIIVGAVAWLIQPWRHMVMTLYIPCFLFLSYYFILPESVRWLITKQKYDEAKLILLKVARVNKTHISDKSLKALLNPAKKTDSGLVSKIIKSPTLLRRVCTTPIWWISSTLIFYGLSINSTSVSDSIYINYILTCAIEIPGNFTAVFVLDRVGRRTTMSFTFFFTAACNIAFIFIPKELTTLRLVVYLLGKFGSAILLMTAYLYTAELYPTESRHTLLAFSSMIGRLGSITAPLTPLLATYWEPIPSLLFGGMAVLSGLLVLTQPETLGTKLPETFEEAEMLGRKSHQECSRL